MFYTKNLEKKENIYKKNKKNALKQKNYKFIMKSKYK